MNQDQKIAIKSVTVMRKTVFAVMVMVLGFGLSACGNKRNVQTVDDSAEYKSARALPPLKKPSRVITADTESAIEADSLASQPAEQEELIANEVADPQTGLVSPDQTVLEKSDNQPAKPELSNPPVPSVIEPSVSEVSARVISDDGLSMLELDAEFDSAWDYLAQSLQKSDVTVFARNKVAGRFSIGCAGIAEDEQADETPKKGRWSFFSRDKREYLEYCALQVEEKRGKTLVSVLDRSGLVVASSLSDALFNRVLNN